MFFFLQFFHPQGSTRFWGKQVWRRRNQVHDYSNWTFLFGLLTFSSFGKVFFMVGISLLRYRYVMAFLWCEETMRRNWQRRRNCRVITCDKISRVWSAKSTKDSSNFNSQEPQSSSSILISFTPFWRFFSFACDVAKFGMFMSLCWWSNRRHEAENNSWKTAANLQNKFVTDRLRMCNTSTSLKPLVSIWLMANCVHNLEFSRCFDYCFSKSSEIFLWHFHREASDVRSNERKKSFNSQLA